jgi:hypothetical protein
VDALHASAQGHFKRVNAATPCVLLWLQEWRATHNELGNSAAWCTHTVHRTNR